MNVIKKNYNTKFLIIYYLLCEYEHNQIELTETFIQSQERKTILDFLKL
jgi:hypothetical protein